MSRTMKYQLSSEWLSFREFKMSRKDKFRKGKCPRKASVAKMQVLEEVS